MSKQGVCPECKVKEGDSSRKILYQCKSCERWFCAKHFEPRLVRIPDYNIFVKYPEFRVAFEEELGREDGHPDFAYSWERFKELDIEERLYSKMIKDALNRSKAYRKRTLKPKPMKESSEPPVIAERDYCPSCNSYRKQAITYGEKFEIFECLECGFKWKIPQEVKKKKKPIRKIVALLLIITVLVAVLWNGPLILSAFQKIIGSQPPIQTSEELRNYALFLINTDRAAHGVQNVSLSEVDSAQRHADDMLKYDFFSHWDTNGYKPYMRYTLAGGKGAVAENIAAVTQGAPSDVKQALKTLEWNMMNNDAEWNWGHRDNILNAFHNKVSIGVSYGNDQVYFVQDFIDEYVQWTAFSVTQNEVALIGSLSKQMSLSQVNIFYDSLPLTLTKGQLEKSPYNEGYTQGTFVGMVVPSGYESTEGITINADTWIQSGLTFQVRFNPTPAFDTHGKGVYTIYLQSSGQASLTSYSIWND